METLRCMVAVETSRHQAQ